MSRPPSAPPVQSLGSDSWSRRKWMLVITAVMAVLVFGAGLLYLGGRAISDFQPFGGVSCAPESWAAATEAELLRLPPQDATDVYARDAYCDPPWGGPTPTVYFFKPGSQEAVIREITQAAEREGWVLASGQPWWGCRIKEIDGHDAALAIEYWTMARDSEEDGYYLSGDYQAGSCTAPRKPKP